MTTHFGPFELGQHSHQGPRETNQDTVLSIALPEDRWLVAVADGMGGLADGERASKTALGVLYRELCDGADLLEAVRRANTAVNQEAKGVAMGTTLVAAVLQGRRAEIVNVGDSRAYCSDALGLIQVTTDHTLAEEATRDGSLLPGEVDQNPGRWGNALARYLGGGETVRPDLFGPIDLQQGGWLLLCTDGLHGVMSAREIEALLAGKPIAQVAAEGLVEEALSRGTQDNVTVALIHWPAGVAPSDAPEPIVQEATPRTEPPSGRPALSSLPTPPSTLPRAPRGPKQARVLIGARRSTSPKKRLATAFKVLLIVVPLMIALGFLVNWMVS